MAVRVCPRTIPGVFDHLAETGLKPCQPPREIYLKGPGMLFPGNPREYLTEVQVIVG
jgi:effector-binding domain-containing protein